MTYAETLEYMYARLPMFTRIGAAAYKADLHNTLVLCEAFGNPQHKFKSIHIAGTNGKGSTSHILAAVFHQSGYKTGLYTSPHLKDFRERIKVSDLKFNVLEMVEQQFVIDFIAKAKPLIESIEPSFFELTVVMAFEYFVHQKVDVAIIETGLGGRLDSTNVIMPELSIITNIGYDHMNILGNTLKEIAGEKAGIIKHGIPVVIGQSLPETRPVFEAKAKKENAEIIFAEEVFQIQTVKYNLQFIEVELLDTQHDVAATFMLDLPGAYQQKNLRTVATAIKKLMPNWPKIEPDTIFYALQNVRQLTGLHGRWELISTNPNVVLDVGHNVDGMEQIISQIDILRHDSGTIHIVIGMAKDKEVEKVLQLLSAEFKFYFTNAHLPRALPADELKEKAAVFGLKGDAFDGVNDAIRAAKAVSKSDDTIIVCGSVFVVGEVEA
jgi:dihydrofolate synthase/folylpolyglutamate synthase